MGYPTDKGQWDLTPLGANCIVRRIEEDIEKGADDLIVRPDSYTEKSQVVEILAVGDKVESSFLIEGHMALIEKYVGTEITLDDEALLIVKEEQFIGHLARMRVAVS